MKPYKIGTACTKCGERGASTEWAKMEYIVRDEKLKRSCNNCKFTWYELPLDTTEESP